MKKLIILFAILVAGSLIGFVLLNEPRPSGTTGVEAEKLTDKILKAINYKGWQDLVAVKWTFKGIHHYLWDKKRNLVEIKWNDHRVLLDPEKQTGLSYRNGRLVEGEEGKNLLKTAWAYFANDSFWLIAPFKLRDPGTERELVKTDRGEALLVTYHSGGVTPGDSYLWFVDTEGLPVAWKMWVDIIPLGGMEFSWESWDNYTNDVKLASLHQGIFTLEISDIETADDIKALNDGEDPFQALFEN